MLGRCRGQADSELEEACAAHNTGSVLCGGGEGKGGGMLEVGCDLYNEGSTRGKDL